jgi:hypothetical protein
LFADSRGKAVEVHDQELYLAMEAAAATQTGLK